MSGTGGYSMDPSYFNKPPPSVYRRNETSNPWNRPSTKTSYPSYQNAQHAQQAYAMPPPSAPGPSKTKRTASSRSSYGSSREYNSRYNGLSQYGSAATDSGTASRYTSHRYTTGSYSGSQSSPNRSYTSSTTATNMYATPPPSAAVVPVQYPPPALPTCTAMAEHATSVPPPTHYTMAPMVYGTYTLPQMPVDYGAYQFGNMYQPVGNGYKRNRRASGDADPAHKKPKRKKPLSQNVPARKDWSVEDARRALDVEKEYNKRQKSQSLIIKFPDIEVNREIVLKFNPKIDTVHFQQPSTPRFCFVSLRAGANADDVINELNQTKFGHGYLTAEHKKDREDEINIGPEDIDPLTLYVGNLAQEITIEDMYKKYPNRKRVDIGYAKKMKFTRYAFVLFHNVDDAIEAFQKTYASEMHSKSLIVRFRRLHGTVGLPGEPKPQNPPKRTEDRRTEDSNTSLVDMEVECSSDSVQSSQIIDSSFKNETPRVKDEFKDEIDDEDDDDDDDDDEDSFDEDQPLPRMFYSDDSGRGTDAEVEIKKEPRDDYWEPAVGDEAPRSRVKVEAPDRSFFQRDVEQKIHRPIQEPKKEKEMQLSLPEVVVKIEAQDESFFQPDVGQKIHRPVLEPKIKEEAQLSLLENEFKNKAQDECFIQPDVGQKIHRPVVEPKKEGEAQLSPPEIEVKNDPLDENFFQRDVAEKIHSPMSELEEAEDEAQPPVPEVEVKKEDETDDDSSDDDGGGVDFNTILKSSKPLFN